MTQIGMIRTGFTVGVSLFGAFGLICNILLTIFIIFVGIAMIQAFKFKASSFDKIIIIFYFILFLSSNIWFYHKFCHSKPVEAPLYAITITEDTNIKEITDNYIVDRIEDGKIIFH